MNNPSAKLNSKNERIVKIGEASKLLGVSIDTLRRWEKSGKITAIRTPGGTRLYSLEQLRSINPKAAVEQYQTVSPSTEELLKKVAEENPVIPAKAGIYTNNSWIPDQVRDDNDEIASSRPAHQDDKSKFLIGSAGFLGIIFLLTTLIIASRLINKDQPPNVAQQLNTNSARPLTPERSDGERAVLAVTSAAHFLEINSDTQINGSLFVRDCINGVSLEATPSATPTAGCKPLLDQDISSSSSPTFASINLSNSKDQIVFQSGGPTGTLTWTPTATRTITLPDVTTTLVGIDNAQTLTNKTISGSSNTITNIPNSALTNAKITITAGDNLTGGGEIALGESKTIALKDSPTISGTLTVSGATVLSSTLAVTGATTLSSASLAIGGVSYTFPSSQGASSAILQNNGSGSLTWATIGATGITADSLDFTEFKDDMTLDASTNIAMAGFNLTLTGNGNVGIGTSSPLQALHVVGQCVSWDTKIRIRRRRRKDFGAQGKDDIIDYDYLEVMIKDILEGDEVLSLNEYTGEFEYQRVEKLLDMGIKGVFEVTTLSGKTIKTTGNHPYLVHLEGEKMIAHQSPIEDAGWVKVINLKVGDRVAVAKEDLTSGTLTQSRISDQSNSQQGNGTSNIEGFKWTNNNIHDFFPFKSNKLATKEMSIKTIPNTTTTILTLSMLENSGVITEAVKINPRLAVNSDSLSNWSSVKSPDNNFLIQENSITEFNPYQWDTITSIKYIGYEHVYDLQIENTHNFVGNNIVAHNTYINSGLNIGASFTGGAAVPTNGLAVSGNVGIGTSSPVAPLQVQGNGTVSALFLNGNVGIGWTSPQRPLMVASDINIVSTLASLLGANGTQFAITGNTTSTIDKKLVFGLDTTDNYGVIQAGNIGIGATLPIALNPAGGNVGIGLVNPAAKLHVLSASEQSGVLIQGDNPTNRPNQLIFEGVTNANLKLQIGVNTGAATPYGFIGFVEEGVIWRNLVLAADGGTVGTATTGNVGIGTSSPIARLHIAGSGGSLIIDDYSSSGTPAPGIIVRGARGTLAAPTALQSGDTLLNLAGRGYGATSFTAGGKVLIRGIADENWTDSANGTYLGFWTTPIGSSTIAERVRITSSGNVGIGLTTANSTLSVAGNAHIGSLYQGITAPTNGLFVDGNVGIGATTSSNKLDVWGNARITGTLTVDGSTSLSGGSQFLAADGSASSPAYSFSADTNTGLYRYAADSIALITGGISSNLLSLNSSGNVGVGTTSPLQALHVVGQCVTGDTRLRRRRKGKGKRGKGEEDEYEDIRIDQIQTGDEILTLDQATGQFIPSQVKGLMDMGIQQTYLLVTETGKQIRTTANHPYLVRSSSLGLVAGSNTGVNQSENYQTPNNYNQINNNEWIHNYLLSNKLINQDINVATRPNSTLVGSILSRAPGSTIEASTTSPMSEKISDNLSNLPSESLGKDDIISNPSTDFKGSQWTKVSQLKMGMEIATLDGWEKIVAIKEHAREQVWDIEVANTHNFVGNNIVAHNTYINSGLNIGASFTGGAAVPTNGLAVSGNVGIGTTSPLANLQVAGTQLNTGSTSGSPLSLVSDEATTNLIVNPSFETGTGGGWALGTGWSRDSTRGYAGNWAVLHSGTLTSVATLDITTSANTAYTVSAWVYNTLTSGNAYIDFTDIAEECQAISTKGRSQWERISCTFTTGASTTSVHMRLVGDGSTSGSVWFDAIQFEQKAYPTTYADGSLGPGYSWSGTAHGSTSSRTAGFQYLNAGRNFMIDTLGNLSTGGIIEANGNGNEIGLSLSNSGTSGGKYSLVSTNSGSALGAGSFAINAIVSDSSTVVNRFIINSSGNVGIGTTGPKTTFAVVGNSTIGYGNSAITPLGPSNGLAVSGNVGIGTTTANSTLSVAGNAHIGSLYQGITAPTNGLFVDGNVGIGATTSSNKLDVWGNARITGTLTVDGALSTGSQSISSGHILPSADDTYDLGSSSLRWRDLYLGPTSLNVVCSSGECGTARTWNLGVQESSGVAAAQGNLRIGLSTNRDFININTSGNVGIGITNPSQKLQVSGSTLLGSSITLDSATNARLQISASDDAANPPIYIEGAYTPASTNSRWPFRFEDSAGTARSVIGLSNDTNVDTLLNLTTIAGSKFRFVKGGDTNNTLVFVDSSGNLGVGVSGINGKFQVNGGGVFWPTTSSLTGPSNGLAVFGNVGIGITTANSTLSVAGNAHIGSLFQGISAPTDGLFVDGNVGIGATTSSNKLDVWGNARITGTLTVDGNLTNSGSQFLAANGSASAPSFAFTNSTSTGLWSPSANTLALTTNGSATSGININSSGNVGIGFTSPAAKLHVVDPSFTDVPTGATIAVFGSTDGTTGGVSIRAKGTVTGGLADFGEYFPFVGVKEDFAVGDLVGNFTGESVSKTEKPYESGIRGVITKASSFMAGADEGTTYDDSGYPTNRVAVALLGRVPVKVSTENGPINIGDYLTSSSIPGVAMKAIRAGPVIGKALENYDQTDPTIIGRVLTFVSAGFADPNNFLASLSLDSEGNLLLPKIKVGSLILDPSLATASASLNSEVELTQTYNNEVVSSSAYNLGDKLASIEEKQATNSANIADLSNKTQVTNNKLDELKAQIASAAAELASTKSKVDSLNLTPPDTLLASSSATLSTFEVSEATVSGMLTAYQGIIQDNFKVFGETTLSKTRIAGDLNIDGTLSIEKGSELNVIGILYLQKSTLSQDINIFDGKIVIDNSGNITTSGKVVASEVETNKLTITNPKIASGSATLAASIGSSTLPANQTQITIPSADILDSSKIFITPTTSTDKVLSAVNIKKGESFDVSMLTPASLDINFNWWIVGAQ